MNNSFVWVKSFCLALRLIRSDTLRNFLLGGDRGRKRKEDEDLDEDAISSRSARPLGESPHVWKP